MNFDPQNFSIGLMDSFSILLPGALLTWLLMGEARPAEFGDRYAGLDGAQASAAFLFASHLFGQLVSPLGSWLDKLYDWARRYTLNARVRLLARRGRFLRWLGHAVTGRAFKGEGSLARAKPLERQTPGALPVQYFVFHTAS